MVKQYTKFLSLLFSISRKETKGITSSFLILFILMGWNVSLGQTSVQNFGTTATSQTSQTASTTFIPAPTSGTTYSRAGATAPAAPINLVTASNPLGTTGAYVRAVASSSASVAKFSPWVGYTGSTEFYTSFKVMFGDSAGGSTATSGSWSFFQGTGAMFSDANNFSSAQVFTGLFFTYGTGGAIGLTYRLAGNTVTTGLTQTSLNSATAYTFEIVGNNKSSGTINYTYSGVSRSVAVQKFDLYLNGVLIGDDLGEASLPSGTSINSGTYIGSASTSNVANIFVDDAVTYNAVPAVLGSVPATTIDLADNGTQVAASNVNQGTTNVILNKIRLGVTTNDATLTGMTCLTAGSYLATDVSNLRVRYSADATLDASTVTDPILSTLASPGTAGTKTFTSFVSKTITAATSGYLFITADVSATATIDNTISVNAIGSANLTIAGATYSPAPSATAGGAQTFKDLTAPTLSSLNPINGATNVATNSNLVLTFSENVKAGSGTIKIYDATNTLFESIASNSALVTYSGTTATINPTNNLAYGTTYYVTVDNGAITDVNNVAFAGFSTNATWSFTTTAQPPVNDLCSSATALTVGATNSAGTFLNATADFNQSPDFDPSTDVWYSFTPTCSGNHTVTVNFSGANGEDINFEVYTACATSSASAVLNSFSNQPTSEIGSFSAVAGTQYFIRVVDISTLATTFDITVSTTVSPFISLDNTGTPASGNIGAGGNNVPLFGFALTPSACNVPFTLSSVDIYQINSDATTSDLSNFRLIVDANNNGIADSGEISAFVGSANLTSGHLLFSSLGQTLTAGTPKRYLLIANVNSGAVNGRTFQASLDETDVVASQTVSGLSVGELQTITSTSITIADNGTQIGSGNILRGTNTTVISKAKLTVGGQTASVTQIQFVTTGSSGAYVQADIAANGFKLWRTATATFDTNTPIGSVSSSKGATATNNDTLSFSTSESLAVGDYYYWLTVDVLSSATPTHTITVNGLTTTSVTSAGTTITGSTSGAGAQTIISPTLTIADNAVVPAGTILVGTTDALVARASLTPSNSNVNVTDINFVTAGNASGYTNSDVTSFKLWKNTTNDFSTASAFGTIQSSTKTTATNTETITFTDSQSLTSGTTYYFWLTATISGSASAGKIITVTGLSNTSVTSSTSGVFITGSSTVSGNQTINANAPTLVTTAASVDAPFSITLSPDDASYRAAITSVKIGATSLAFTTSAGNITLDPANASNTLLRTPGNKTIDITASNYTTAQVTQLMLVGTAAKLAIALPALTAPATNGGALAIQPTIKIQDKYNNDTTSTEQVQATVGLGSWTLNGTNPVAGVNGTATFTNLTATSGAAVTGATITFSLPNVSGTTVLATSGTFNIPAPSATHLVFVNPPTTGVTNSNVAQVRIEARTASETIDTNFTGIITVTASGPGAISATSLSKAATSGVATFNDIKFDTAGSYSLKADASTFTQVSTTVAVIDPIAKWTFEGVTTTNTGATVTVTGGATADAGLQQSGTAFTAVHTAATTVWSNPSGNGSGKSVSATAWAVGDYFQFKVNTSSYSSIKLLLDQTGSNTGPRDFKLQYSTTTGGASGYTDFTTYSVPQTAAPAAIGWSSTASSATSLSTLSFDLSSLSVLNGKTEVYFRVVDNGTASLNNTTVAAGGTGRIDNFTVLGTACQTLSASVVAGTSPICAGNTASFTITGTPGALVDYTLTSGNGSVTLDGSGSATVTVSNAIITQVLALQTASKNGCSNAVSGSATVTVNANITPTVNLTSSDADNTFCTGTSVTFTATPANLGGGSATYNFKVDGGSVQNTGSNTYATTTLTNGQAVTVDITVTGGTCLTATAASSNSISNNVNPLPIVTAANVSGCAGTAIALSGTPAGGTFSVANPYTGPNTTYTYTYTNANGCIATSAAATITNSGPPSWYLDADGDHYYTGAAVPSCTSPGAGYTTVGLLGGGDCADNNAAINPGATEICYNNIDDNCNTTLSEGCAAVPVNMTASYNGTTLASLGTAVPAVSYTYPGTSNLKFRFSITNTTTGQTSSDIIQTSRYVTIPGNMYSSPGVYTIKASAVINDEVVAYSGNTITVNAPVIPKITLASGSCGATLAALTSTLTANAGQNATGYIFRIRLTSDNDPTPTYGTSSSSSRFVSANSFAGFPLSYGTSYQVSVQYSYTDPVTTASALSGYGAECTVVTPSIPTTGLASPACGSQVSALNANISATSASYATAYQFRIRLTSNVGGPYTEAAPNASRFSSLTTFGIQLAYNTQYSISVRYSVVVNGSPVWSDYGPECIVKTPFFPTTSLVQSQCGLTTATSLTQQLNIIPYPGFPSYRVKLDEVSGESIVNSQEIVIPYSYFKLNQFSIAQLDKNYNVSVAIKLNGVFGDYATACDLFTQNPAGGTAGGSGDVKANVSVFKATAYPNPFANNFMLDIKTGSSSLVNLKVYDMLGRMIEQRNVSVSDMETATIGEQYPAGVYNVVVSQENDVETLRVVKR